MIGIPKTRLAVAVPIARTTEPSGARVVNDLLTEIAEQGDRVALDIAAQAFSDLTEFLNHAE
ncbi:MAG: hypothetical protein AB7G15_07420 [Alphaproteobacteria bacterium]